MPTTYLPNEDHIARYVRSRQLKRDDDRRIVGVFPEAYALRPGEQTLSVDWMEWHGGAKENQLQQVVRHAELKVRKNDAYAVTQVGAFAEACAKYETKVRIIHEPRALNPAHSAVHRYPMDNHTLYAALANLASQDVTGVSDIES